MLKVVINLIFMQLLGLVPNWRLTDDLTDEMCRKFRWRTVTSPPDTNRYPFEDTITIGGSWLPFLQFMIV